MRKIRTFVRGSAGAQHPWGRGLIALALVGCMTAVTGCGISIPSDPDGTLDRARGGVLRVGASADGSVVTVTDGVVAGPAADLVEGFAETIDADVEWTTGGEETLVGLIEAGDIDLAIGGMTDQTPWLDRVGVTRGITGIGSEDRPHVFFVPLGENALLSELETYLDGAVNG